MRKPAVNPTSIRQWPTLIMLATTALLSYWATLGLWNTPSAPPSAAPHVPDIKIEHFSARKLDRTGQVQYSLNADSLLHFGDDGSAQAEGVRFEAQPSGKPRFTVLSPKAVMHTSTSAGDAVALTGGVIAHSTSLGAFPSIQMESPEMILFPDSMLAHANHGITLESSSGHVKAERMVLDANSGVIRLTNAEATFDRTRR